MNREDMLMRPEEYRVMHELEDSYWWYRGLRVLLEALMVRYAPPARDKPAILDAGCGTGANLELLQSYGNALGVDISDQAVEFCLSRGLTRDRVIQASVAELPFRDGMFDAAVSFDVICNIVDDVGAFAEVGRVLKPGGIFIVQLPAYRRLWSRHDVAVGHKWRYNTRGVREKLSQAGFGIERLLHVNTSFFPFVAARRLMDRRALANGHAIRSEVQRLPPLVNGLLSVLYTNEMRIASHVDLRYGLSIVAVARKSETVSA